MLTQNQADLRNEMRAVMNNVIAKDIHFDVHSLEQCFIGQYRAYKDSGRMRLLSFNADDLSRWFGLPRAVCADVFALSDSAHQGDKRQFLNAQYHLDRLEDAFSTYPDGVEDACDDVDTWDDVEIVRGDILMRDGEDND